MNYYTIGLAGHIDHGKTTLTGALTGVNTDRLKEEKERNISIEPGFAPFHLSEDMVVSMIDVPGHERFIRQMIAGVAGIDLVIPVVAADEGVMPQTKEHLEILSLLGIKRSIIVITKADLVEADMIELVKEDIRDYIEGTGFEGASILVVDGKSGRGIEQLKTKIGSFLPEVPSRNKAGALRLPIDQVFSLQGHGTIVRGTIFDGELKDGEQVTLLPDRIDARVRQIQTHNEKVGRAYAGQRVAVNLAGTGRKEVKRGHVVVNSDHYAVTSTIDLIFTKALTMDYELKQRSLVTVHIGTAEVRGTIVFFDRNVLKTGERDFLYCQIRLQNPVVAKKGDHVIIRRPSPVETIGGGTILNVSCEQYKFGEETIAMFEQMSKGTPAEQLVQMLHRKLVLSKEQVMQQIGLTEDEVEELSEEPELWFMESGITSTPVFERVSERVQTNLTSYHQHYPMRRGMLKAEVVQEMVSMYPLKLVESVLDVLQHNGLVRQNGPFLSRDSFTPTLPSSWKTKMGRVIQLLEEQGSKVTAIDKLIENESIPEAYKEELKQYLLTENVAVRLTPDLYVHHMSWEAIVTDLKSGTNESFTLQEAKDILKVSRKYLVPILEHLDESGATIRNEQVRYWRSGS
ncbi:selenocysteine-specific translation elongation factor [Pseudalkalibacillus hwajinpoensis]|uniref:selenocysteine-specific translation elongation factor n=1 Tax=Guptibacillus hwajinpoensis TaxID=208199 RepID=UPI00325B3C08